MFKPLFTGPQFTGLLNPLQLQIFTIKMFLFPRHEAVYNSSDHQLSIQKS